MALEAVARVAHRGAASTDNSGDGAGLLTQIPHRLFYRDAYRLGLHLQPGLPFGVGAFFLPREPAGARRSRAPDRGGARRGRDPASWAGATCRSIPPPSARPRSASCPVIRQVLVGRPALAATRRRGSGRSTSRDGRWSDGRSERTLPGFYACSLSCRTIVYKALLTGTQLPAFFTDFRYPGVRERDRGLPPALLDQHAARAGRWPSRSGCWPTTARSTPCGATGTR